MDIREKMVFKNIRHLAEVLDGRDCGEETTKGIEEAAKELGAVFVFGASDDLIEFRGAINDEFGCYDGGTVYITQDGLFEECEEECRYSRAAKANASAIKAVWCDEGKPFSWTYETDIPHETFDILEDGEGYCRGIVFLLSDIASPF